MGLPPLKKAWTVSANNAIAAAQAATAAGVGASTDHKNLLWKIKERLCTVGSWTVVGSSDSLTAGMDNVDRWVAATNVVWTVAVGSIHSWIVLKQTGLLANYQLCLDCSCTTNPGSNERYLGVYVSHAAGFSGGATNARPTATDEITLRNSTAGASGLWFYNFTTPFSSNVHYITSVDKTCHRLVLCANGVSYGMAIFDTLGDAPAALTQPVVSGWLGGSANESRMLYAYWNDAAAIAGRYGTINYTAFLTSDGYMSAMVGQQFGYNEIEALAGTTFPWVLSPIGVASETRGVLGRVGALYDLWWTNTTLRDGTCFPLSAARARTHVQFGNLVFPWADVIPQVR